MNLTCLALLIGLLLHWFYVGPIAPANMAALLTFIFLWRIFYELAFMDWPKERWDRVEKFKVCWSTFLGAGLVSGILAAILNTVF